MFRAFESQGDCVLESRGLRANEPSLETPCRSCRFLHPERMEITQPRVARNELPWVGGPLNLNPERVLSKTLNRYRREERVGERRLFDCFRSFSVMAGGAVTPHFFQSLLAKK